MEGVGLSKKPHPLVFPIKACDAVRVRRQNPRASNTGRFGTDYSLGQRTGRAQEFRDGI